MFFRADPNSFELIRPGQPNALSSTRFSTNRPTIVYLFGFSEASTGPSTTDLKNGKSTNFYKSYTIVMLVIFVL